MKTLATSSARGGKAFTLLETLVYVAVLGVILLLAYEAFWRAETSTRSLAGGSADILRALRAGERWRADLREATGPVKETDSGGVTELVIPARAGEVRYRFLDGTVSRRAADRPDWQAVLPATASSRMVRETRPGISSWRWELELAARSRNPRIKPLFTFLAVTPTAAAP